MAFTYNKKVVVSGKHVEVYTYKKSVWRDFEKRTQESVKETSQKEPKQLDIFERIKIQQQKQEYSVNRTRTEIRRLINSNPQLNKFMTLTFADNFTDLKKANYLFNQFIKRMNYKYPNFRYLAIPEFQQRGAVHYHLLCDMPFIHYSVIHETWGHGNIDIKTLKDVDNIGAYVCKYLSKDMFDERTFGKKKYFRSQTLTDPIEILGWLATKFIERFLSLLTPTFEKTFESEWVGEVEYKAYRLDNLVFKNGVLNRSLLFKPI
ncbi:MAG: hypothetical protein KA007_00385 [Candidatus Pacebacteria bacterium]|nr:hypothetical protein [Candidatus Paceibacterota bacterium]